MYSFPRRHVVVTRTRTWILRQSEEVGSIPARTIYPGVMPSLRQNSRNFFPQIYSFVAALALPLSLLAISCQHDSALRATSAVGADFDSPATVDPPVFDAAHPPLIFDTVFEVEGAGLNAVLYEAQGPGPHPTVVLLHGFPGNEKNQDLAQAFRRAGWNALIFHYRGSWGSGGDFSFVHILEDVREVLTAIRAPEFAVAHRIDTETLALVGHSMGGFAALISGAELPEVDCIVSLAGANLGGIAQALSSAPAQAGQFAAQVDAWSGPIRGPGGEALVAEIAANARRFNPIDHAPALAQKKLLLVAGARDVVTPVALHHTPLVDALFELEAANLQQKVYENADHSFSGQRIALADHVTSWLTDHCASLEATHRFSTRKSP